jgi:ribosomal protein S18 acetylase RimI-like enzyme
MDIERRIFPWLWWYGEDEWRLILMMGSVETYLAYAGGDIIGYETHTVFETRGHVDRLGIHPRYQGNYYGQDLLLHSLRRIAAQGGQDAALSTQLHNTPAQRLYSKHGFRRSGAPMIFYGFALDGSHSLAKMVATPEAQPPQ